MEVKEEEKGRRKVDCVRQGNGRKRIKGAAAVSYEKRKAVFFLLR